MQQATIDHLNQLNQAFYRTTAQDFSETRQTAWQGWARLSAFLPAVTPLRVLDVGCGNGRFAHFLHQHNPTLPIHYHGIDTQPRPVNLRPAKAGNPPERLGGVERAGYCDAPAPQP
ncbi:MAG UNVERIFIED_CONTAM: class I SAM-dependent methyltransferase [Anaerolineae bacterium]